MTEYQKAKAWRASLGLTQKELGEKLGYSQEAIFWFERGLIPPSTTNKAPQGRAIKPWIWQRYKLACAGLESQLHAGEFKWNHDSGAV